MKTFASRVEHHYKWWVFFALTIGLFASVADFGSVAVALPSIAEYFRTDLPTAQWVAIGYALTISALLLSMGRLADIVGLKRIYVIGFSLYVIGAGLSGSSTQVSYLILFRIIQGVGSAMTQGSSIAMLISAFPASERGRALGLLISVVGVGAIVGPVLGGIIVDALGWRWVFFTSSVLGAISTIVAVVILIENPQIKTAKLSSFDWLGAALSAGGLVIFMISITSGPRIGWTSPTVAIGLMAFLAVLIVFIFWERRVQTPMLDMNLFIHRPFSLGIIGTFVSFIGMSSVGFLMPFYLQYVLGFTPTYVGLIIVPSGICFAVIGPISGRLSDRYGWRRFNIVGITLCTIGMFILSTIGSTSALWFVMFGIILQSSGMGLFNAPNSSSIFSVVEQRTFGVVSGFLNLARNASNVTGIALVTAIVTATMASMGHPPTLAAISESTNGDLLGSFISGIRTAYSIVGVILIVGIITSLFNKPTTPKVG